jgi:hypothetical protein
MNDAANVVVLFFVLFLFVVWFYGPWQKLCVDWGRQQIFEARNAIFDLAADGELSFDSPEYREIRSSLEILIRFSHRISWPRLAFYLLTTSRNEPNEPSMLSAAIDRISNDDTRARVKGEYRKVRDGIMGILISRSLLLLVGAAMARVVRIVYEPAGDLSKPVYYAVQKDAAQFEAGGLMQGRAA